MPSFQTPRSRTLNYAGDFSVQFKEVFSWQEDAGCGGEDPLYTLGQFERGYSQVQIEGAWYILEARLTSEATPLPACLEAPDALSRTRRWRRAVRARIVSPDRLSTYADSGWVYGSWTSFSIPGSVDVTAEGDYEATAPAAEWLEYGDLDPSLVDSNNFPDYGLGSVADHLEGTARRFYEQITSGGVFTARITLGDATASVSALTTFRTFEMDLPLYYCRCLTSAQAFQDSATAWIEPSFEGVAMSAPISHSTAAGSGSASSGSLATSTSSSPIETYTTCRADLWPSLAVQLPTEIRSVSGAYPASLDVSWISHRDSLGAERTSTFAAAPSATGSRSQVRYDVEIDVNTSGHSGALDEYAPSRFWLTPASLTAAGERADDWRLQARGQIWTVGDFSETSPLDLQDGSSATGWAGENAAVSSTSGVLEIEASGGRGAATYTPSPQPKPEAWRYLRLRIRSSASMDLTLAIDNDLTLKRWDITAGAAWAEVDIDLCAPDRAPLMRSVQEQYSRWPLNGGKVADDPAWGVSLIKTLAISGIPDGETLEIDWIRLVRSAPLEWSLLPAFNWWIPTASSQEGTPFVVLNADGRIADWPGVYRASGSYSWPSIASLASDLGALAGLAFTPASSFPDSLHTNSLEALHLGGSGAMYDGSWSWVQDVAMIGTAQAQELVDQVEAYPECGDVWGWAGGAYGGALVLPLAKILRGQAWGLVLGQSAPLVSETVEYKTSPGGVLKGSDSSSALGYYVTGSPWGQGHGLHRVHALGRQTTELANRNRWRRRAVFRRLPSRIPAPVALIRPIYEAWRLVPENDELGTERSLDYPAQTWSPLHDWGEAHSADLCHLPDPEGLMAAIEVDGTVKAWLSYDQGDTWAELMTLFSNAILARASLAADGAVLAAAMRPDAEGDPGVLVARERAPDGSWSSEFTLQRWNGSALEDLRVESESFDIWPDPSATLWELVAMGEGETTFSTYYSADNGRTWTKTT
jgi:hypothetical protein